MVTHPPPPISPSDAPAIRARRYFLAANSLTVLRLILLPLVLYLVVESVERPEYRKIALAILIYMQASDIADGYLARRGKRLAPVNNLFGAILDPLADKIYLNSTYLTLSSIGLFPWWASIFYTAKDALLMLAWAVVVRIRGKTEVKPNVFGKAADSAQAILIFCILLGLKRELVQMGAIFVAAMVIAAAVSYAIVAARRK